jgi:NAD(P)-dependent dehydrogenase (short-subunit alcohol dehydrogenase family)
MPARNDHHHDLDHESRRRDVRSAVARRARELATRDGEPSFAPQDQQPPGLTAPMRPVPDHGERSYVGHGRLEGMAALITGGDSGIGRAVAIAYAREGADVALSYLPEEQEDAEETRRWVEEAGRRALLLPGDLREEQHARSLVHRTLEELGRLDVLVNNAAFQWGRAEPQGLAGITSERLHRTLTTNLEALFWITQEAAPHLGPGASVINCSSIQSYDPSVPLMDYAATKAAINNVTVNLAADLGPRGIRVNAVAPGPIWTPLNVATRGRRRLRGVRGEPAAGPRGPARRVRGRLRVPGEPRRGELRLRHRARGDRG